MIEDGENTWTITEEEVEEDEASRSFIYPRPCLTFGHPTHAHRSVSIEHRIKTDSALYCKSLGDPLVSRVAHAGVAVQQCVGRAAAHPPSHACPHGRSTELRQVHMTRGSVDTVIVYSATPKRGTNPRIIVCICRRDPTRQLQPAPSLFARVGKSTRQRDRTFAKSTSHITCSSCQTYCMSSTHTWHRS